MIEYKLGLMLWYEPTDLRHSTGFPLKVTKVGRKWVDLGDDRYPQRYRVAIGQVAVDGGQYSSPGRVWLSQSECLVRRDLEKQWRDVAHEMLRSQPPAGLMPEHMREAKRLLGIK